MSAAALLARLAPVALVAVLCAQAGTASAHEFWIEPERHAVDVGEPVGIALAVATGWPGERFARQSRRIVRFALVDGAGERDIPGADGDDPAGRIAARTAGTAWAVYRSTGAEVRLDAEPFEAYLREEGLEAIVKQRARRGASQRPGVERYSRCAKALLTVGSGADAAGDAWQRPVGLALELVPTSDPRTVARDGRLAVRLLRDGAPLGGALVKAMRRDAPGRWHAARTDADGLAVLDLPRGDGTWLVNAVHMTPAQPRSGVDWDSTWSSLTFETTQHAAPTP